MLTAISKEQSMMHNDRILITGANGFLGKHVLKNLKDAGYTNLYSPPSQTLDLTKEDQTTAYFRKYQPDYVIHLAAVCGGIGLNKEQPGDLTIKNLRMGLNIIDACRYFNVNKLVMVGTVCSMAANAPVPFTEEDFLEFNRNGPGMPEITNAGYGLAKRMLYEVLRTYHQQYAFQFAYLIPVNMLGEHDNFNPQTSHVIPALIKKFLDAKIYKVDSVNLWGSGTPTREFVYAGDVARAIRLALEDYSSTYPLLIGTGQEISIKELAEKIKEMIGFEGSLEWDASMPDGQMRRCLNVSKAKELLNFEARTSLNEALERTVKWYLATKLVNV